MSKPLSEFLTAVEAALGWSFERDVRKNRVYVVESSGTKRPFTDHDMNRLASLLTPAKYGSSGLLYSHVEAGSTQVDPLLGFIRMRDWDGADRFSRLGDRFESSVPFEPLIKAWMVGAVAKIVRTRPDQLQNPVLLLVGGQGLGKSHFVRWLASGFPEFHAEMILSIRKDGGGLKDQQEIVCSNAVIELAEIQATLSASGAAALKMFLTAQSHKFRPPYSRVTNDHPVIASYIGTANALGGFLTDKTGNRRYRAVNISAIDWSYSVLDIQQLWAQAYSLFVDGAGYMLEEEVQASVNEENALLMRADPIEQGLTSWLEESQGTWLTATDIAIFLQERGIRTNFSRLVAGVSNVAPLHFEQRGELFGCRIK